ncbi:MAG: phosphohydrolase [Arcobacter sp.]|uniref:HD-GYP domain-containing protein n=1 Tax=uncultured Arcobacter sp. TaxID=165434 RepID=UPI000CAFEB07|nr:HD domain-containing phosphohydrolase [uncultured Arcobacter sp.]PLY11168.1 MAG: phosphohydrolase [Arcobacter sp.]
MKMFKEEENVVCECSKALLLALGQKDEHTQLHSERVVELSSEVGIALKLDINQIKTLRISAAFHDIGKIGIPDNVLLKPSSFNDEEWEIMKSHAINSEKIVNTLDFENSDIIAKAVRHHHEYYNGNGYPDRLKGESIPIYSRIISLADSYDAMSSPRPYHNKRLHAEIMKILEEENGIKHDPKIFEIFKNIIQISKYKVN